MVTLLTASFTAADNVTSKPENCAATDKYTADSEP